MVVSSAYFTTVFSRCVGVQAWVYSVNGTQPWGAANSVARGARTSIDYIYNVMLDVLWINCGLSQ